MKVREQELLLLVRSLPISHWGAPSPSPMWAAPDAEPGEQQSPDNMPCAWRVTHRDGVGWIWAMVAPSGQERAAAHH